MEPNLAIAEMASTKNLISKRQHSVKDTIFEHLTTVVHTLVVAFLAIVIYLFGTHEIHISTWHGLLLTIGVSIILLPIQFTRQIFTSFCIMNANFVKIWQIRATNYQF